MIKNKFITTISICASILFFAPLQSTAQISEEEKMFWQADTLLTQHLDTVGREQVVMELRNGLSLAVAYCIEKEVFISADSVASWANMTRWAVILNDKKSIDYVKQLNDCVKSGDRGSWKYYISYMTKWGYHNIQTANFDSAQKLDLILSNIFSEDNLTSVFYEERLVEMGPESIPDVLNWVNSNLIPRMGELDKVMRSEEDLIFTQQYDRFRIIFSMMYQSEEDKSLLNSLQYSKDENMKRFVADMLEMIEI